MALLLTLNPQSTFRGIFGLYPGSTGNASTDSIQPLSKIAVVKGANFGEGADNLLSDGRFSAVDSTGIVWAWGKTT
jgi:hypothetical protein